MRTSLRAELLARLALTLGALAPYWPLLGFDVLVVTDDGFMSDIWNGELPPRVFIGETYAREGVVPRWSNLLCSGAPLGGTEEPLSLAAFSSLPVAAALDALLLTWILIAAHGTYSLARRVGATRAGSVLAGIAFAASGYLVCHLKHLAILGTVVWLPVGLSLLDRGLRASSGTWRWPERVPYLAFFGLAFGLQTLAGFPQSAYICALTYGVYALYCVGVAPRREGVHPLARFSPLAPAALTACLGAAMGALSLLPLFEAGSLSDRAGGNSYEWATVSKYGPAHVLMFLSPYAFGDVSDGTYPGGGIFWEDYGYVGLATVLLAFYVAAREPRRSITWLFWGLGIFAFLFVLGPATPVFELAFHAIPGMSLFRFPTRFLVVVDLCLCVLGALGLSRLTADLRLLLARVRAERTVPLLVYGIVLATALDLFIAQPRQNAMVRAEPWLSPPATVRAILRDAPAARVFTPFHMDFHLAAFARARGWSDLRPYYALRDLAQPNSASYWGLATADCYAGIAASWHVDVWGDRARDSELVYKTISAAPGRLETTPAFTTLMRTYGVTHVISPFSLAALAPPMPYVNERGGEAKIYRVPGTARARIAEHALPVSDTRGAVKALLDPSFDPDRSVVLHDAHGADGVSDGEGNAAPADVHAPNAAVIEHDGREQLVARARAPRGGYLVLADTFYPGWQATVDGRPTPIFRANLSLRAVRVPPGDHRVIFRYRAPVHERARTLSFGAAFALLLLLVGSLSARSRSRHADPQG